MVRRMLLLFAILIAAVEGIERMTRDAATRP